MIAHHLINGALLELNVHISMRRWPRKTVLLHDVLIPDRRPVLCKRPVKHILKFVHVQASLRDPDPCVEVDKFHRRNPLFTRTASSTAFADNPPHPLPTIESRDSAVITTRHEVKNVTWLVGGIRLAENSTYGICRH